MPRLVSYPRPNLVLLFLTTLVRRYAIDTSHQVREKHGYMQQHYSSRSPSEMRNSRTPCPVTNNIVLQQITQSMIDVCFRRQSCIVFDICFKIDALEGQTRLTYIFPSGKAEQFERACDTAYCCSKADQEQANFAKRRSSRNLSGQEG